MSCSICLEQFSIPIERDFFFNHMRIHRHTKNANFYCLMQNCQAVYTNFNAFQSHFRRKHVEGVQQLDVRRPITAAQPRIHLQCNVPLCGKLNSSLNEMIKHLKKHIREGASIVCPFINCTASYKVISSFSSHLSRCHGASAKNIESLVQSQASENGEPLNEEELNFHIVANSGNAMKAATVLSESTEECTDSVNNESLQCFALFLLKLEGHCFVPKCTVQCIVDEISCLDKIKSDMLNNSLPTILSNQGVPNTVIDDVIRTVNARSWSSVCHKLRSVHTRSVFFKNNFDYISPISLNLGMCQGKACFYHYVPLIKSIQLFVKETKHKFVHTCNHSSDILCDLFDGNVFSTCHDTDQLQILLYQDSFEIVNPLGSSRKKHKLLAVYAMIGNLPVEYRSCLDSIILVMLIKESYVKFFGQKIIFHQLLCDLKMLETEGIECDGRHIKCQLFSFLGDNLGSHTIGGFSESFSAEYFCRFCLTTKAEFNDLCYTISDIRTEEKYDAAVAEVEKLHCMVREIKFRSIFNELEFFHVCKPALPPCLGHDLMEGIVALDMALFVNYFVNQHWFSYDLLNCRIASFPYSGFDASSKPPLIPVKAHRLIGQAAENWCILRLFPLIVLDLIRDKADPVWLLLLQLREIVQLVTAPKVTEAQVGYLDIITKEYLDNRKFAFCDKKLLPKHHFLIHYGYLTLQFGPLIRMRTLRLEREHSFFKKAMRNVRSFKNVSKTLSHLHQLNSCYVHSGSFLRIALKYENSSPLNLRLYSESIQNQLTLLNICAENTVTAFGVEYYGRAYKKGMYVFYNEHSKQQLGCIVMLLIKRATEVYVAVEQVRCEIIPEIGVYCLYNDRTNKNPIKILNCSDLLDYLPLISYVVDGFLLMPLKHAIVDLP